VGFRPELARRVASNSMAAGPATAEASPSGPEFRDVDNARRHGRLWQLIFVAIADGAPQGFYR